MIQKQLFINAEKSCQDLLDEDLKRELKKHTRYISLGVDSYKTKVSLNNVQIQNTHAELVALYDLIEENYYWTGKSFPTVGQENGLIRITDISSHFINTEFGKTMVLGCHDLSIYSNRGMANTKNEWRKKIRIEFRESAKKYSPEIVLHHPHNTDSIRTWSASWSELKRDLPNVKSFAGSGKYFRTEGKQRSKINEVLDCNRLGNIVDFVIYDNY